METEMSTLQSHVFTLPDETNNNKKPIKHACKINAQFVNDHVFE